MPEQKRAVFGVSLVVRWGDMDINGHVNNAVYSTYFEQARVAWFDSVVFAGHRERERGYVVARIACNFLKPITYPATLWVSAAPGKPGRTSFPLFQAIHAERPDGEKLAEAEITMVHVDRRTGKSEPLPEWLRKVFLKPPGDS